MAPSTLQQHLQVALAAGTTAQLADQLISTIMAATKTEAAEAWRWSLASAFHTLYPRAGPQEQMALVSLVDAVDLAVDGPVKPVLFSL